MWVYPAWFLLFRSWVIAFGRSAIIPVLQESNAISSHFISFQIYCLGHFKQIDENVIMISYSFCCSLSASIQLWQRSQPALLALLADTVGILLPQV